MTESDKRQSVQLGGGVIGFLEKVTLEQTLLEEELAAQCLVAKGRKEKKGPATELAGVTQGRRKHNIVAGCMV